MYRSGFIYTQQGINGPNVDCEKQSIKSRESNVKTGIGHAYRREGKHKRV